MDFELNQDQLSIREMVRDLARSEILPNGIDWDEHQHFPKELFTQLGELGLLGVVRPEEYGGAGLGYVEYAVILEEISAVDGGVGLGVAAHNSLCTNHLYQFGSEALKREFVPKLASGEWIGAWGLTEPEAGSDAGGTRTTAVRDGNEWVLNGSKTFITHATVGDCVVAVAGPLARMTIMVSPLSSSPSTGRVLDRARKRTNWVCGVPTPRPWFSKIAGSLRTTCLAKRATASCRR